LASAEEEIAAVAAAAEAAGRGKAEVATDDEVPIGSYEEPATFLDHQVPSIIKKMEAMDVEDGELDVEENARQFEDVEQEAAAEEAVEATESITSSGTVTPTEPQRTESPAEERAAEGRRLAALYSMDHDFKYEDFVARSDSEEFPTFKYMVSSGNQYQYHVKKNSSPQDFMWSDQAAPVLEHLYNRDTVKVIDEKFRLIKSLTYMTIGR